MRQGARAVRRYCMLLDRHHLAEGFIVSIRAKDRVIAEAFRATRREDQFAVDAALELLNMPVGPGDAERGHERGTKRGPRGAGREFALDLAHRRAEIAGVPGPTGGIDAGRAVERLDAEARIRCEGGQGGSTCGACRLDAGILGEGRAGLLRLGKIEIARRDRVDAIGREQLPHFPKLAGIMRGDDKSAGDLPAAGFATHQPMAAFCSSTRRAMPDLASPRRDVSFASLNVAPSAVACTSTSPPAPVMTKFASVCALESSS